MSTECYFWSTIRSSISTLHGFPLSLELSPNLISTSMGLAFSGIPWPLAPHLKHSTSHNDLLFHSWSLPTWCAAVSNSLTLTHSLCLRSKRISSEGLLLTPQSKRAIIIIVSIAQLVMALTYNLKLSVSNKRLTLSCSLGRNIVSVQ